MSFGEDVAQMYRDIQRGDEIAAVAFLEQLAGPGPALELAIGTGRIALPLAARGIRVDGVDISPAMVDQLRAKPGGDAAFGHDRRLRRCAGLGHLPLDLRGVEHAVQPADPGRPGALLRERRRPSHRRRLVRRGGLRAEPFSTGCATINTWMQRPSKSTRSGSMCFATMRRRR